MSLFVYVYKSKYRNAWREVMLLVVVRTMTIVVKVFVTPCWTLKWSCELSQNSRYKSISGQQNENKHKTRIFKVIKTSKADICQTMAIAKQQKSSSQPFFFLCYYSTTIKTQKNDCLFSAKKKKNNIIFIWCSCYLCFVCSSLSHTPKPLSRTLTTTEPYHVFRWYIFAQTTTTTPADVISVKIFTWMWFSRTICLLNRSFIS